MKSSKFSKLLAGLSFFVCASLSAAPLTVDVDVAGIQSYGELDDSQNTVLDVDVGANSLITSVTFDVNITAFSPSFLSEIGLLFEASDFTGGLRLYPSEENDSDTGTYSGFYDLADIAGVDRRFNVGSDGILRLQFFEDFDDILGAADGIWNFGTITFGVETVEEPGEVPEPATILLMGAGLAMLGFTARRRRTA